MTTEPKHTPTPWRYVMTDGSYASNLDFHIFPENDSQSIAKVFKQFSDNSMGGFTPMPGRAEANAAFIVRACNEHAALVAVAETLKRIHDIAQADNSGNRGMLVIVDKATNALAALEAVKDGMA